MHHKSLLAFAAILFLLSTPAYTFASTITHTLTKGSSGADVLALQQFLVTQGYLTTTPNGTYGPATTKAVTTLQKANKLQPTGSVGPKTLALIQKLTTTVAATTGVPATLATTAPTAPTGLVTEDELHQALYGATSTMAGGGLWGAIAASQKINNLQGVTISGAQVNGISGLQASDIPALPYLPSNYLSGGIDISSSTVTATGATTARTLAAQAADVVNVKNFGAKCDGVTDDTAAIQAAINAGAGKALVYVPPGTNWCMVSGLSVPSNSHITIDGKIKLSNNANATVINIATFASYVTIDGTGIIDGNRANNTGGGLSGGVASLASSYIYVRNLTIQNTKNWPVNIVTTTHCSLDNLYLLNGHNSVEFAAGSNDCWARKLYIYNNDDEAFAFYGGVYNSGISDSIITTGGADGISVLNDSAQSAPSHDIVISNNIVTGMSIAGIGLAQGIGAAGTSTNIVIDGNRLYGNGLGGNGFGGVKVNGANYVTVSNNLIGKDGNSAVEAAGVYLLNSNYVKIIGNSIYDEGQGGTLGTGIHITGTSYVQIDSNSIWDDQGTKTMAYGLDGTFGSNSTVVNNYISGTVGGNSVTLATDTYFSSLAKQVLTTTTLGTPVAWMTGQPTGTPTNTTGGAQLVYDTTHKAVWVYNLASSKWDLVGAQIVGGTLVNSLQPTASLTTGSPVIVQPAGSDSNGPLTVRALGTGTTTVGSSGAAGSAVLSAGALIDNSGVRQSLGATYTVPANTSLVRFTQGTTVSASTITLPTAIADGQSIQFVNYAGAVTSLTFSPSVNGWTNTSTFNAYSGIRVRWDATASAWYREE